MPSPATAPGSDRADARLEWARAASGSPGLDLQRASADAGFRSYWRGQAGDAPTVIVMDSPPELEDVRPWLRIRDLLESGGVRVPRVLARDVDTGFLLLEDLGADTLLHVLDAAYRHLIDAALAHPQVLVHRDFMPRNLMPAVDGPAVLDFQDAVRGPIAYDPLSLFKDAFLSWPDERVLAWLARYHARAADAGLPVPALERFMRDADLIGVQRHLKVMGIFARLHHRDAKPKYLADAPRFLAYLDAVLPRHPALAPLAGLIDRHVRPALAAA